jgi:perosamine synthetase
MEGPSEWKAPDLPGVRPQMLLPRVKPKTSIFPFNAKGIGYYYFARNGIFALCKHWRLEGKEVLFPSYFHGVELEALLAAGVRPNFYPVTGDMQIDFDGLLERITPETRAVYMIHYLGFPGPIEALRDICREHNLKLIEDCALALLSCHGNRPLGSFGDAAVFCLYKTLPLPTGGALWIPGDDAPPATEPAPCRAAWSNLVSSLVQHYERHGNVLARSALNAARALLKPAVRIAGTEWVGVGGQHFEIERAHLGMNRLNRTLLAGQNFKEIVENRRRNYLILLRALSPLSKPVFQHLPVGVCPLFYPLRVPYAKEKIMVRLHARGITAVNFWRQSHPALPVGEFPEAERLRSTVLELPCHQDLSESDMGKIVEIVKEEWALMRLNRSATASVFGRGSLQENLPLSIAGRSRAS